MYLSFGELMSLTTAIIYRKDFQTMLSGTVGSAQELYVLCALFWVDLWGNHDFSVFLYVIGMGLTGI